MIIALHLRAYPKHFTCAFSAYSTVSFLLALCNMFAKIILFQGLTLFLFVAPDTSPQPHSLTSSIQKL